MKILVTGGAGFIGSHIVDAYINDGHEVVVIDNLSTGKKENLNPKAKFYQLDICSPEVEEIFKAERPEVLNHHAAQIDVRKSVADPTFDCKVNILGFLNLMEAARRNGVKKVIFASSGGTVYGEQREFPATEDHPTNPVSPYGVAKLTCEKYLHYYYVQYGIPYIVFRYANIYGPRQNPHGEAGVVAIFINKMLKGEQPIINGDGKQTRDYVYVGDVAELNRRAVSCDVIARSVSNEAIPCKGTSIFNVGTGIETNVNELFHLIKNIVGINMSEQHAPAKKGEQARSSIVSKQLNSKHGFAPKRSLKDGLSKTVEWFKTL